METAEAAESEGTFGNMVHSPRETRKDVAVLSEIPAAAVMRRRKNTLKFYSRERKI